MIRHALRQLHARPGWALSVILVLAIGPAITLAAFMLTDAVLFRPLGVTEQENVVRIGGTDAGGTWLNSSAWPAYEAYRTRADGFSDVAAEGYYGGLHWRLGDDTRRRAAAKLISGNYFDMMGVRAAHGRLIAPRDDAAGAPRIAVVSERFWREALGAREDVVGSQALTDRGTIEVVGVVAAGFDGLDLTAVDVWLPARAFGEPEALFTDWGYQMFEVFGRLGPGTSLEQANAQVDAITQSLREQAGNSSEERGVAVPVSPLKETLRDGDARSSARLLGIGALLILLTACANAVGLLLVQGERRRGEIALRAALGATSRRIGTQLMLETALLVVLASALGVLVAYALVNLALDYAAASRVLSIARADLPAPWRVGAVTLGAAALVALVAGWLPALRPLRRKPVQDLAGSGSGTVAATRWRLGRFMVVVQFALTLALAISAGLLARSLWLKWHSPLGFAARDSLVMRLDFARLTDSTANSARVERMLALLRESAAVESVATAAMVPIADNAMTMTFEFPQRDDGGTEPARLFLNPVGIEFFAAMQAPLLDGRGFSVGDDADAPPVAVVSRSLASRYWPNRSAIGATLQPTDGAAPLTVVGVVDDIRYQEVDEEPIAFVYAPAPQRGYGGPLTLVVAPRAGAADAARAAMIAAVRSVAPDRAVAPVATLGERVADSLAGPRFLALAVAAFAVLGLALAAFGIGAVFAFLVAVRRRELGLRLAVGATAARIFRTVLGDAARLVACGVLVGLPAAWAASRLLQGSVRGVSTTDPEIYATIAALVAAIGLFAVLWPARAAARTDPQRSLRCD